MKVSRPKWLGRTVCIVILAVIFLLWWFVPYPTSMYLEAKVKTRYQPAWPISKADYAVAKRLVSAELSLFEFIRSVHVESSTKISFITLKDWSGPLAASGRCFVTEKLGNTWVLRPDGQWFASLPRASESPWFTVSISFHPLCPWCLGG